MLLVGCGTSRQNEIDLTPEEILSRSAERMIDLQGFEFLIDRSGESVFLDLEETISFSRAAGKYTAPDHVQAEVRVVAPGLVTEVHIIRIKEEQWETNLLTGDWQPSDPRYSFNLALLFDAEIGIQAILNHDITNPILVGYEELPETPGKELLYIEATLEGGRAYQMSYGMIDNEALPIKVWIDPNSFDLHRILMTDPADPGDDEDTLWQIDFWSFGSTFEIVEPVLSNE